MSVRRTALEALMDITDNGAYANLRLKSALGRLEERDAAFVSAAVYTALEHLSYIDCVIKRFAKGRMNPSVRGILRLGVCQLMYMNVPASAACNESVKLVKEIGKGALAGYVNGVMRSAARAYQSGDMPELPDDDILRLCMEYSWPEPMVKEYVKEYGVDFTRNMLSCQGKEMTVRAQYPYTAAELERWLCENGLSCERGALDCEAFRLDKGFDVSSSGLFADGCITVQSESAMLVCRSLGLSGGERILDACAAPGGKSAYIASILKGDCDITAWDVHEHRIELMEKTLKRLNVSCVKAEKKDASCLYAEYAAAFDAVLVDAPCSGLGVFGKPDVRFMKDDAAIERIAKLQGEILSACSEYVRPGGILVYSTCTVSRRENGDRVASFLGANPDFVPAPLLPPGLAADEHGGVQLFPHIHNTEGFYIARMQRRVR